MRKAIVPSVEVAGNILTGTRTSERRRLPDQTGMGAMQDTRERDGLSRIWGSLCSPQVTKNTQTRSFAVNCTRSGGLGSHYIPRPFRLASVTWAMNERAFPARAPGG